MKTSVIEPSIAWARNHVINGNFDFWQRGTSIASANNKYFADRFSVNQAGAGQVTLSRSTDVPASIGATYSALATVTSTMTPGATDFLTLAHRLEGNFFRPLAGKTVTLSFWVKSSIAGTYSVAFANSGYTRSMVATYTISQANTWEKKSVTFTHDVTGTWLYDTGVGLDIHWTLSSGSTFITSTEDQWFTASYIAATGSTNLLGTNAATFQLAQVMLNEGSVAAPFALAGGDYEGELRKCQRYYEVLSGTTLAGRSGSAGTVIICGWQFQTAKRVVGYAIAGTQTQWRVYFASTHIDLASTAPVNITFLQNSLEACSFMLPTPSTVTGSIVCAVESYALYCDAEF